MKGRVVGVITAICWLVYGIVTKQYAFVFTEVIFIFIYVHAAIVFTRKRNQYRRRQELTVNELDDLRYTVSEMLNIENKIAELKTDKNKENLKQIKVLQKTMFSILKETSDKIN